MEGEALMAAVLGDSRTRTRVKAEAGKLQQQPASSLGGESGTPGRSRS